MLEKNAVKTTRDLKKAQKINKQKKKALAGFPRLYCDLVGKNFLKDCDKLLKFYDN